VCFLCMMLLEPVAWIHEMLPDIACRLYLALRLEQGLTSLFLSVIIFFKNCCVFNRVVVSVCEHLCLSDLIKYLSGRMLRVSYFILLTELHLLMFHFMETVVSFRDYNVLVFVCICFAVGWLLGMHSTL